MQMSTFIVRGRALGALAAAVLGVLPAATVAVPTASAQPQCTAAGLSNTIGTVAAATGQYLSSHPDADQAVTNAGAMSQQDAENSIRSYFASHPQQWSELQAIARPLAGLRAQCQVQVAPAQIARLFDAMAT
jgi:hemophore-related protein